MHEYIRKHARAHTHTHLLQMRAISRRVRAEGNPRPSPIEIHSDHAQVISFSIFQPRELMF